MNYLQLLKKYPNYISYGALHFFFSSPGQTFFISLFVLYFIQELGIEHLSFDWIYSGGTLLSALVLPYIGKFVDVIRLRYVSVAIGISMACCCIGMFFVSNLYILFLLIFGLRLSGQALMTLTANTAIGRFFHKTRGKALSLINFGVSIGETLLPPVVVFLIALIGWQYTWILVASSLIWAFIPSVIFLIPYNSPFQFAQEEIIEEEKVPDTSSHSQKSKTRKEALKEVRFYLLILISLFMPFFSTGIMINNSLVSSSFGWSAELAALCLSSFGIARLLMNFLAGALIDRFSGIWIFALQLLPTLIGSLLMLLFPSPSSWLIFFISMGISGSLASLSGTATWAEIYGTLHLGSIRSFASTFGVFSTAAAPIVLGIGVADQAKLDMTFGIAIISMIILTGLGIWLARKI